MDLQSSLYYSATFLAGGVFAWWLRSRRDLPERMRLVEHFERRARLAETEQEQAIRTLNENEIRTRKIEGTYDGLRTKVRELEEEGQATEQQALALREALQAREAELGEVQARVGGLEASNKDLTKRTAEAEDRRKLADSSIDGVRKELAKATRELELSKAEEARLKQRLLETEQRAEEAERLQVALAEVRGALGERETLLQEMRSRVDELKEEVERLSSVEAELEARRRDLVQRDAQLAELRKRLEELKPLESELEARRRDLADLEKKRTALDEQVRGLTPLEGQLEASRNELNAREREWSAKYDAVLDRAQAAEEQLAEARGRIEELVPLTGELEEAGRRLAVREGEWKGHQSELQREHQERLAAARAEFEERLEKSEARQSEAVARAEKLEAELATRSSEGQELAQDLAVARSNEQRTEAEIAELEKRVAAQSQELEELKGFKVEAKGLQSTLGAVQRTERALTEKLEREEQRAEAALAKLEAQVQVDGQRRDELEGWKERFSQLSATHKAAQLKADRLAKRVEELEQSFVEAKTKLAETTAAVKERDATLKAVEKRRDTLERQLERAATQEKARKEKEAKAREAKRKAKPVKDDLKELAGIGPALEKKLNSVGVKTYEALAKLDAKGVEALAEEVNVSAQLVRKNKWVTTAKRLHKEKYGSPVATKA